MICIHSIHLSAICFLLSSNLFLFSGNAVSQLSKDRNILSTFIQKLYLNAQPTTYIVLVVEDDLSYYYLDPLDVDSGPKASILLRDSNCTSSWKGFDNRSALSAFVSSFDETNGSQSMASAADTNVDV